MTCFVIGFIGAAMGLLFINWFAPCWYRGQIAQLKARIQQLEHDTH